MFGFLKSRCTATDMCASLLGSAFNPENAAPPPSNSASFDVKDRNRLAIELRLLVLFAFEWGVISVESEQPGGTRLRRAFRAGIGKMAGDPRNRDLVAAYPERFRAYHACIVSGNPEDKLPSLGEAFGKFVGNQNFAMTILASGTFTIWTCNAIEHIRAVKVLDE